MRSLSSLRRPAFVVSAVLFLIAGLTSILVGTATAASTAPVRIEIDAVSSDTQAPGGTPGAAVPYVLVEAGQTFTVTVSFYDVDGNATSFNKDTALSLTSNKGSLEVLTALAMAGEQTAFLTAAISTPVNQVVLTVDDVAKGRAAANVAPDTSYAITDDDFVPVEPDLRFDVLGKIRSESSSAETPFAKGIGGTGDVCAEATSANPVCALVILPRGSVSDSVLLSRGPCDGVYGNCKDPNGALLQTLADLGDLYSKTAPATMLVTCDRTVCGQGAIHKQVLSYSIIGNGALEPIAPCPSKGTIGALQDVCVDYVEAKRDGANDTLLPVLFDTDLRVSAR